MFETVPESKLAGRLFGAIAEAAAHMTALSSLLDLPYVRTTLICDRGHRTPVYLFDDFPPERVREAIGRELREGGSYHITLKVEIFNELIQFTPLAHRLIARRLQGAGWVVAEYPPMTPRECEETLIGVAEHYAREWGDGLLAKLELSHRKNLAMSTQVVHVSCPPASVRKHIQEAEKDGLEVVVLHLDLDEESRTPLGHRKATWQARAAAGGLWDIHDVEYLPGVHLPCLRAGIRGEF